MSGESAAAPVIGAIGPAQQTDGIEASIDALRTTDGGDMVDLDPETEEIDTEVLEEGQEFLVLSVTITNVSDVPREYNAISWYTTDPATNEITQMALFAMTGSDLSAGDLEPGASRSGEVTLVVPEDASNVRISYDTQLFGEGKTMSWDVTIPPA